MYEFTASDHTFYNLRTLSKQGLIFYNNPLEMLMTLILLIRLCNSNLYIAEQGTQV